MPLSLLMLAGLLIAFIVNAAEIQQRHHLSVDNIRIVSANLRQIRPEDEKSGNGWEQRKELCRDVLLAQSADIFCFQENFLPQIKYFQEKLPDYEYYNSVYKPKYPNDPFNPILYSAKRFEKLDAGGFWLSDTPEVTDSKFSEAYTSRFANWILLRDRQTGQKLYILNTHLDHKSNPARIKQITVLLNFARTLPGDVPKILTGDLNSGMDAPPAQLIRAGGWHDSYTAIHGPAEAGGTAHRFGGAKFLATPEGAKRKKIDFIFHKLLKPVSAEIIRDNREGKYPSDHYFVSAEFSYTAFSR